MSLRELMATDLETIHADTTEFGAGEACTYTPKTGAPVSTRMIVSRSGTQQPVLSAGGMYEAPRASAFVLVSAVATTDLRDTVTDAAGNVWSIEATGMENAAVRELLLVMQDRKAFLGPTQQERR